MEGLVIGQLRENVVLDYIGYELNKSEYGEFVGQEVEKIEVVSFTPDSFEIKIYQNVETDNFLKYSLKDGVEMLNEKVISNSNADIETGLFFLNAEFEKQCVVIGRNVVEHVATLEVKGKNYNIFGMDEDLEHHNRWARLIVEIDGEQHEMLEEKCYSHAKVLYKKCKQDVVAYIENLVSYKNYGDANPLWHGGFWIKKSFDNRYDFVKLDVNEYDEENPYTLYSGCVDFGEDEWYDLEDASEYADWTKETSVEQKCVDLVYYYGAENFGAYPESYENEEVVKEELGLYGIEV